MLKVHNTITGLKEEFKPINDQKVNMYVCGITPYDKTHMGHGRCYVVFDVIRRYLKKKGYAVRYIQNFTDIDDKIIKKSLETNSSIRELVDKNVQEFMQHCVELNIEPADSYPRVTQNIPDIIKTIEKLISKGYAYVADGDVYYSVKKFSEYGKLSNRKIDELKVGVRILPDEKKLDTLDFALWKKSKAEEPQEASWQSPWSKGRPGWHIECSVMSLKELKTETIDIHGGGQDLIFPHHENEIAQTEAYTGKLFAKYWIHNGFVTVNKEKMSKSLQNFFDIGEILSKHGPMVVRLFLISQHYRAPLDYSEDKLEQAKNAWERITRVKENTEIISESLAGNDDEPDGKSEINKLTGEFFESMDDDFNTSGALSKIYGIVNLLNEAISDKNTKLSKSRINYSLKGLIDLCSILGLQLPNKTTSEKRILEMSNMREQARKEKNWPESDRLRNEIEKSGYIVEDTKSGPRVKKK